MKIDRKRFFDGIRNQPFPGRLTKGQVDGITAILDEWERRELDDLRWLAYMLATAKHETDHTMKPIREYGGKAYYHRMYDKAGERPRVARNLGNSEAGDGVRFHGRGYVQLTGRRNYTVMNREVSKLWPELDLLENPDSAMDHRAAAYILFEGMIRGTFTGKRLEQFFTSRVSDWKNARKIINGLDRAEAIASIAKEFYADLVDASKGAEI